MNHRIILAIATATSLLWLGAAAASPVRCADENKTCVAACGKPTGQMQWRNCVTICAQRQAACHRTGCWNNGTSNYCGLLRK